MNQELSIKTTIQAALVLAAVWFLLSYYLSSTARDTTPDLVIEATKLRNAARGNEAKAHAQFDGKVIEMQGKIFKVTMSWYAPTVSLGVLFTNVDCELSRSSTEIASKLRYGDTIKVKGVGHTSGGDISLKRCTLL